MRTHPLFDFLSRYVLSIVSLNFFHDQTNQKKGYLETMRNNEKGMRKVCFLFYEADSHPVFNETGTRRKWLFLKWRFFFVVIAVYLSIRILSLLWAFPRTPIIRINGKYGIANVVTRQLKSMAISWAGEKPIPADGTMTEHLESRHATPSTAKNIRAKILLKII